MLDPGDGGTTHTFHTHSCNAINALLGVSESVIQCARHAGEGVATGLTAESPSSSSLERITAKADNVMGLIWPKHHTPWGTLGEQSVCAASSALLRVMSLTIQSIYQKE